MLFRNFLATLTLSASVLGSALAQDNGGNGGNQDNQGNGGNQDNQGNGGNQGGNGGQAVLDPNNIQDASASDGQGQGVEGVADGQAASAT